MARPDVTGSSARDGATLLPLLYLHRPGAAILPFLLAILETYGIQAIHLHPKSVTLLAVFAYTCEAWINLKPSVAYFRHLFSLRSSGLNQSSGYISFIATTGTEGDFIDLKWMKKVEDFRSRWLFIDILEESELFLVTRAPPPSSPPGPARPFPKRP
jgi:hypothetical protein